MLKIEFINSIDDNLLIILIIAPPTYLWIIKYIRSDLKYSLEPDSYQISYRPLRKKYDSSKLKNFINEKF